MKKISIIIIIVIIAGVGYWGYKKFYSETQTVIQVKTVDDLLEQQDKEIKDTNEKIQNIEKETNFDPQTATPKEVSDKLGKFLDSIKK